MVAGYPKSRIPAIIAGISLFFCLAYGGFYLTATTTSGDDVMECKAIADVIRSEHPIPESVSTPSQPAAFCTVETRGFFLKRYDHVQIYGVIDRDQQDSITQSLQNRQFKDRQLLVEFYEKENWKTWSDPASGNKGGARGPETPLRTIVIE